LKLLTFGKDLVASGGYLILAAGDQVYSDTSSVVGNIGVIMPKYSLKGALDFFSIEHKSLTSN
jgi:ClpP class serine protease